MHCRYIKGLGAITTSLNSTFLEDTGHLSFKQTLLFHCGLTSGNISSLHSFLFSVQLFNAASPDPVASAFFLFNSPFAARCSFSHDGEETCEEH